MFCLQNKNNKAFTLLELLVVIAIIGILTSVILASLENVRARARDAAKNEEARQIIVALEMYYQTYGGFPSNNAISTGTNRCLGFNTGEFCLGSSRQGNTDLNLEIRKFMPGLSANRSPVPSNLIGIWYSCNGFNFINSNSMCTGYVLTWHLSSSIGNCAGGLEPETVIDGVERCRHTSAN